MNPSALIYDAEIVMCIPPRDVRDRHPGLLYCGGWGDHAGMGISVICAFDYLKDEYRIFLGDNLPEFAQLVRERETIIGFNSLSFDDKLCAAHGVQIATTYDLMCEVRVASGQPAQYGPGTRGGYSLEKLAQANLGVGKSSSGALAPELWQQNKRGAVIDYCLRDVKITRQLFEKRHQLVDPTGYGTGMLTLREPEGWV